mgnify:CR=1 FL=1
MRVSADLRFSRSYIPTRYSHRELLSCHYDFLIKQSIHTSIPTGHPGVQSASIPLATGLTLTETKKMTGELLKRSVIGNSRITAYLKYQAGNLMNILLLVLHEQQNAAQALHFLQSFHFLTVIVLHTIHTVTVMFNLSNSWQELSCKQRINRKNQ